MPKEKIEYRTPCCGGKEVFGMDGCEYNSDGKWICHCTKDISHNYTLWYAIVQAIRFIDSKPHLLSAGSRGIKIAWEGLEANLKADTRFGGKQPKGDQIKKQWGYILSDYEHRYSLSNASAGFETHPEETPYDIEVKYLYKDIKKQQERDARLLESTKQMNSEINFFFSQVLDNSDGDESDDDNCSISSSSSVQVICNKDHERLVTKKQQIDPLEANETDHEVAFNPKRFDIFLNVLVRYLHVIQKRIE